MANHDEQPLPVLIRDTIGELRELAEAEIALAKSELKAIGISLGLTVAAWIAAAVLAGIALAGFAATAVLGLGGSAPLAVAVASSALLLIAAAGTAISLRQLRSRNAEPPREAGAVQPQTTRLA